MAGSPFPSRRQRAVRAHVSLVLGLILLSCTPNLVPSQPIPGPDPGAGQPVLPTTVALPAAMGSNGVRPMAANQATPQSAGLGVSQQTSSTQGMPGENLPLPPGVLPQLGLQMPHQGGMQGPASTAASAQQAVEPDSGAGPTLAPALGVAPGGSSSQPSGAAGWPGEAGPDTSDLPLPPQVLPRAPSCPASSKRKATPPRTPLVDCYLKVYGYGPSRPGAHRCHMQQAWRIVLCCLSCSRPSSCGKQIQHA